jgi:ubiquinone/menaquinone biosynthesis C-methylase UbiE
MICQFCNSPNYKKIKLKDLMFGTAESFIYLQCNSCLSLSIETVPFDLSNYYTKNYAPHRNKKIYFNNIYYFIVKLIIKKNFKFITNIFTFLFNINNIIKHLNTLSLNKNTKILEIGCGSGELVRTLRKIGYSNTLGIDPYIDRSIENDNILKLNINKINNTYDIIILNHVIEHFENISKELSDIIKLLKNDGKLILAFPISNNYFWNKYFDNWIQLDPPRHLSLPSIQAFNMLCDNLNLNILQIEYNSEAFSMIASEENIKGISLNSKNSIYNGKIINKIKIIFYKILYFKKIKYINNRKKSDQILVILEKKCSK